MFRYFFVYGQSVAQEWWRTQHETYLIRWIHAYTFRSPSVFHTRRDTRLRLILHSYSLLSYLGYSPQSGRIGQRTKYASRYASRCACDLRPCWHTVCDNAGQRPTFVRASIHLILPCCAGRSTARNCLSHTRGVSPCGLFPCVQCWPILVAHTRTVERLGWRILPLLE